MGSRAMPVRRVRLGCSTRAHGRQVILEWHECLLFIAKTATMAAAKEQDHEERRQQHA